MTKWLQVMQQKSLKTSQQNALIIKSFRLLILVPNK